MTRTTEEYIEFYADALREAKVKAEVVREARKKAWDEKQQAAGVYEFLVASERHADAHVSEMQHRLTQFCTRQALELSQ